MKKILFLVVILFIALGASCKKKEVTLPEPPPPPPPPKQTEQELIKSFTSLLPQLEPGEVITVQVDKSKFISDESEFQVSLFPLEFISPAEKPYIEKYMFPSVVWRFKDSQLGVYDLTDYLDNAKPGEKFWILKESPAGTPPFKQIPTLLVKKGSGEELVLDQNADEMLLRANWGK